MDREKLKKILAVVFFKGAFSNRNLSSLLLVAVFFGIYIAAGGKIAPMPNLERGDGFGEIKKDLPLNVKIDQDLKSEIEEEKKIEEEQDSIDLFGGVSQGVSIAEEEDLKNAENSSEENQEAKDKDIGSLRDRLNRLKGSR